MVQTQGAGASPPRRDGVLRPAQRGGTLNALGEGFRKQLGYPARDEEIARSWAWARKQRASSRARWADAPGEGSMKVHLVQRFEQGEDDAAQRNNGRPGVIP